MADGAHINKDQKNSVLYINKDYIHKDCNVCAEKMDYVFDS